jgi:hypothetical protein
MNGRKEALGASSRLWVDGETEVVVVDLGNTKVDTNHLALSDVGIDLRLSRREIDIGGAIWFGSTEVGRPGGDLAVVVGYCGLDECGCAQALDVGGSLPRGSFKLEVTAVDKSDEGIAGGSACGHCIAFESGLELPLLNYGSLDGVLIRGNGNSQNLHGKQGKGKEGRNELHDSMMCGFKESLWVKIIICV